MSACAVHFLHRTNACVKGDWQGKQAGGCSGTRFRAFNIVTKDGPLELLLEEGV